MFNNSNTGAPSVKIQFSTQANGCRFLELSYFVDGASQGTILVENIAHLRVINAHISAFLCDVDAAARANRPYPLGSCSDNRAAEDECQNN